MTHRSMRHEEVQKLHVFRLTQEGIPLEEIPKRHVDDLHVFRLMQQGILLEEIPKRHADVATEK